MAEENALTQLKSNLYTYSQIIILDFIFHDRIIVAAVVLKKINPQMIIG